MRCGEEFLDEQEKGLLCSRNRVIGRGTVFFENIRAVKWIRKNVYFNSDLVYLLYMYYRLLEKSKP